MAGSNDKIINCPPLDYVPHPGGLGCAMFEKMKENANKIAQINGLNGSEETYKSFLDRIIRTALTMRSKGVTEDDLITISSNASTDVCVPYIATLCLGAKPVTLDVNYPLGDIIYMLKIIKPKIIFAGLEVLEKMETAVKELPSGTEIVVFGNTSTHAPFSVFLQPHTEEEDFKPVPAKHLTDTALMLFSSGSTGLPKGVCLNHYSFLVSCHAAIQFLWYSRVLTYASLNWASTIHIVIGSIMNGGCRVVVPRFDPSKFWELVDTCKPAMVFLAPIFVVTLTKFKRPETLSEISLKMVTISGAQLAEKHLKCFQNMVPEAIVMLVYAQTEFAGPTHFFKPNNPKELAWLKKKPSSSGTGVPGFTFKVVDTTNEELLGPNQKGELRIKSKIVMNGYCNRDSSDLWDDEGFVKTGDIVYYDEDRCFYIIDRVKEILKVGQSAVSPAVVENILLQHPAVEGALVIGIPHKDDGHHLMALVVLSKQATTGEIKNFVDEKVDDAQKLTGGVKIIDKIPMSATGKIRKGDIRDKILNGEI